MKPLHTKATNEVSITLNSEVTLHYTLSLANGKVAETTIDGEPVTLVVGGGGLIPAFANRIVGLKAGDKRRFEIPCQEAFGPSEAGKVRALPRTEFATRIKPEPDLVVAFELPSGEETAGTIVAVTETEVFVDFSHPLAGYDLVFEVEIISIQT